MVSKFGIRYRMNLKHIKEFLLKTNKNFFYFRPHPDNKDSYLDVEDIPSKLKECKIKTN